MNTCEISPPSNKNVPFSSEFDGVLNIGFITSMI